MVNLLIVDDNIYYTKSLVNYLLTKEPAVRLIGIATSGKETIKILSHNRVDLLILDLKMPGCNGLDILNQIDKLLLNHIPKIMVITGESDLLQKAIKNPYVSNYALKADDIVTTYQKISTLILEARIEKTNSQSREKILKELTYLGFNLKHIGTQYLLEAILMIYNSNTKEGLENLEKYVYSALGSAHHKTPSNIKSNINKSIEYMFCESDFSILKNYFLLSSEIKPTAKLIISTVLEKI